MGRTVLVVGASGFVGKALVGYLLKGRYTVRAAARQPAGIPDGAEYTVLPDLTQPDIAWGALLDGIDSVVYLAARVHVMNDTHPDPLAAYMAVNHDAALSLAQAAAQRGIGRFVYLSSVKVNGEQTSRPLTELDIPSPTDPYGVSKFRAENALLQLGRETGLDIVVLRPPLVYGPGVKANFMALGRAAGRGVPLPIGAVRNQRSMIYVENLADLITLTLEHPAAAGEVFFASDGEDLSTAALTRDLAEAQGKIAHLPRVPVGILALVGRMTGRTNMIKRLTGSLQISSEKAQRRLEWSAPYPVWQAVARTGRSMNQAEPSSAIQSKIQLGLSQKLYLLLRTLLEKIAATLGLIVLLPIYLFLAILIRLDSPGPAIFRQERAGRLHQPFKIYKFRTMRSDAPNLSTEEMQQSGLKVITRLGAFLRRTSLDELPQLLNVLKGEMSFIGPRPALMTQYPVLHLREQTGVDQLLPGITGHAQVTGRDNLSDKEKVERDSYYLKRLGPKMDWRILKITLNSILSGVGNK
ncbi:hybrid nucleoside-diphosphate sugar epimerase/sugar transferase [Deinococcus alpinitundrae]|uniref:hybrid nucleoside-diphosphate sugar epimerase/sugar transferase n=1 Tax=Deinococcus alpinitundrae TaxID=468913 RepID=UPI001379CB6E|nr:hybrid nucleoside-diphosphate sugar epimerase/sugar transferase [Deinococcus alpinitundrae]